MSQPSKPGRVYGEKEIGQILERATELQRSEPTSSSGGGMTLAELEEVAREAGIDVSHIRRAALEVDTGVGSSSVWSGFLGEELRLTREATLPGELPGAAFEQLLGLIQSSVSDHGQPSLLGRTLTWQGGAQSARQLRIVVSSRDGETGIRVEENLSQMAGGLFGGVGGGVGFGVGMGFGMPFGLGVLGSALAAGVLSVGTIGLTYLGVRSLYRSIVRGRRRVVDDLFARLVESARDAIPAATPEGG